MIPPVGRGGKPSCFGPASPKVLGVQPTRLRGLVRNRYSDFETPTLINNQQFKSSYLSGMLDAYLSHVF
jgi:hypothetical protein